MKDTYLGLSRTACSILLTAVRKKLEPIEKDTLYLTTFAASLPPELLVKDEERAVSLISEALYNHASSTNNLVPMRKFFAEILGLTPAECVGEGDLIQDYVDDLICILFAQYAYELRHTT